MDRIVRVAEPVEFRFVGFRKTAVMGVRYTLLLGYCNGTMDLPDL